MAFFFFKNNKKVLLFLFVILTGIVSLAQLPACKDSFPTSLLPNSSFEKFSGCSIFEDLEGGVIDYPQQFGGMTVDGWHCIVQEENAVYHNYNCRVNKPGSIFDTTSFFSNSVAAYPPAVPLPLPDSSGFAEIHVHMITPFLSSEQSFLKTYVTSCLPNHLYAGQPYVFSFYFAFGKLKSDFHDTMWRSPGPFSVSIFGRQDCPDYPYQQTPDTIYGCLANHAGWVQLGTVRLQSRFAWQQATIAFTPTTDIACVGIGPDCSIDYRPVGDAEESYYMDKFILAPKADFSFKTITAISGNTCTGGFVLKAPAYPNATYQWYKDEKLITNATSSVYTVPDLPAAQGSYAANISLPYNTCVNTLPYSVTFSDIKNFSLGNDTTACAPAEITLNATWPSSGYLWQDGTTNAHFTANKTGTYWVDVTDKNGCTKRDSVIVNIQGCNECDLYIPSAFTPNNDGLNDLFRTFPNCANIGLQKFKMTVYNRWGQVVFNSNNINSGWDGTYKRQLQNPGAYVYYIEYSFKEKQVVRKNGTIALLR